MTLKHTSRKLKYILYIILVLCLAYGSIINVQAQPTGAEIIFNQTDIIDPVPASNLTTAGGSFTTMVLSGVFQTPRWKAYVGNVTGRIALRDSDSRTIYDWDLVSVSGQIYVTRNDTIDWSTMSCASEQTILDEQTFLNIQSTSSDSINRTFNDTIHKSFFVGTTQIAQSTCWAIATYVEDTRQAPSVDATFQEILLQDNNDNLVFATIIEQAETGFDSSPYDFQLIVPEDPTSPTPTTYYFFAEIN
jgi:hypothetical protein